MYPVSITGDRLALREFTHDDVDAILKVYGDPVVTGHLSFEPRNRDQVAAMLNTVIEAAQKDPRTEYSLAAASAATGEAIGFARLAIDAQHPGQSSGQIGFALRADQWGQGLPIHPTSPSSPQLVAEVNATHHLRCPSGKEGTPIRW
ncbi:GNAT family N-acetyltransferase [Actinomadura viridis]|uniref:GNAT family N-acetyltransferase n=1 Tax=Actinomadura viridis TaxID=58110 RepID=UPI0036CC2F83